MDIEDSNKNKNSSKNLQEKAEEANIINQNKQIKNSENKSITKVENNDEGISSNKDINNNSKDKTQNNNKDNNKINKYMFDNIIKIKKENCSQQLLDEQWNYQKILLDYNLLDFTCKNYYIYY